MLQVARLAQMRFAAAASGRVDPRYYKVFKGEGEPPELAAASRNVVNLYEMPTLFYAGTAIAFAGGQSGALLVGLGWAYFALRCLHTAIHVTANKVMWRFRVFGASWVRADCLLGRARRRPRTRRGGWAALGAPAATAPMWKAFVFGVVVAAAIGPIALLIFGTGARQGFASGAFAGLGAALADLALCPRGVLGGRHDSADPGGSRDGDPRGLRAAARRPRRGDARRADEIAAGAGTGAGRLAQLPADVRVDDRESDDLRDVRGHRSAIACGGLARECGGTCGSAGGGQRRRERRDRGMRAPPLARRCRANARVARSGPRLPSASWRSGLYGLAAAV